MHHIQKEILHKLVHRESARFSELKPGDLDGNIFTYHLHQLIAAKYVEKDDGCYRITQKGKLAGINLTLSAADALHQAHCVLFLAVRNTKGQWLLRKRLVHPAYGRTGFIHYEPVASEPVVVTAKRALKERSNLDADLEVLGGGYISLFKEAELESYINFTLLFGGNVEGEIHQDKDTGENFWYGGDFTGNDMIPSMPELINLIDKGQKPFFVDMRYEL